MWRCLAVLIVFAALPAAAQRDAPENQLLIELLDKVERLQTELNELRNRNDRLERELEGFREEFNGANTAPAPQPETGAPPQDQVRPPSPDAVPPVEAPPVEVLPAEAPPSPDAAPPPPAAAPPPPSVRQNQPPVHGKEERRAYDAAIEALSDKDSVRLRRAFSDFLERYPRGQFAASAKYWIGESWYAERDFDKADKAFKRVVNEHTDHLKSEDASLKIGYIHAERGQYDAAREILHGLAESAAQQRIRGLAQKRLKLLKKR